MPEAIIDAGTLTANLDQRSVSGLLVPFGEECRSNLGHFSVGTGAFTIPADHNVVGFNKEHAREDVLGRATGLKETPEGIVATFSIGDTPEGDEALMEIALGKRKNLSAEVSHVQIKDGKAVGGKLFGAALVKTPAFPSATLLAAAADTEEPVEPLAPADGDTTEESTKTPDGGESAKTTTTKTDVAADGTTTTTETVTTVTTTPPAPAEDATNNKEGAAPVANASVPNTLAASAPAEKKALTKAQVLGMFSARALRQPNELDKHLDEIFAGDNLFAALAPVNESGTGAVEPYNTAPQWIGEIWDGLTAQPIVSDLIGSKDLLSKKIAGWKFTTKPTGGTWAGNGAQITSTAMATTPYEYDATYWAGGNTFGREFWDFGESTALLDLYFQYQTENFQLWLDQLVLTELVSGATSLVADNPAGLAIGAGFSALIDGASELIGNRMGVPTFALVPQTTWKAMAKIPQDSVLGYLSAALNLEEGQLSGFQIRPVPDADLTGILVGNRAGADLYTLAGSPVRAEALQIATGRIDVGLYGYGAVVPNKADAFALVTPYHA